MRAMKKSPPLETPITTLRGNCCSFVVGDDDDDDDDDHDDGDDENNRKGKKTFQLLEFLHN